jgi:hypothetical protein
MGKQETLKRIERNIAASNLGKARDSLHGLIHAYPNDLSLRRMLGEVYWKLQFPSMAGCYWYLEEFKTEDMKSACAEFEKLCGNDPLIILKTLKIRTNIEDLESNYAKERLLSLKEECIKKHRYCPDLNVKRKKIPRSKRKQTFLQKLALIGCAIIIVAVMFLIITGIETVISWFK